MQISVTARHCEITTGVRSFAQTRLEKLSKFASDIHGVRVIIQPEGKEFQAEVTLHLNGHEFVSTEVHLEAGAAIEKAVDRMEAQLRKFKEKRVERHQDGPTKAIPTASPKADEDDEEEA